MSSQKLVEEIADQLTPHRAEVVDGKYVLLLGPRACWNLRTWGIQKRAKRGYFNLERDLHKFYP